MSEFLENLKRELIEDGVVNANLFYYIDDRINEIVSDKLSQCMGDLLEQIQEGYNEKS